MDRTCRLPFPWENEFFGTLSRSPFTMALDVGSGSASQPVPLDGGFPQVNRPWVVPRSAVAGVQGVSLFTGWAAGSVILG
eukprot:2034447-Amphidinium_carterae.1